MIILEQDINHTGEVIIGTEQGTTFPMKIGTLMCNALIDTGAKELGVVYKLYTPPYHPASNGRIEGFHAS